MERQTMIASYETQTVHSAIIDALVEREVERRLDVYRRQEAERTMALLREIDRLHGLLDIRRGHDARLYGQLIDGAGREYRQKRRRGILHRLGDVWWGAVGLIVEGVGELVDSF